MINYSTALRINPQKPEEPKKAYAMAQYSTVMTLKEFAQHIASHGCTYDRADIEAVLNKSVDCMREKLLEGVRIRLGDLGVFAVSLESEGAASLAEFTADNIKDVNVIWRPGEQFLNLMKDAEFNHVATREAAQKVVAAQKVGKTDVDITPSSSTKKSDSSSSSTGDSGNSGNSGNSGLGDETVTV